MHPSLPTLNGVFNQAKVYDDELGGVAYRYFEWPDSLSINPCFDVIDRTLSAIYIYSTLNKHPTQANPPVDSESGIAWSPTPQLPASVAFAVTLITIRVDCANTSLKSIQHLESCCFPSIETDWTR